VALAAPLFAADEVFQIPVHLLSDVREEAQPEELAELGLSGAAFFVAKPDDHKVQRWVLKDQTFGHDGATAASWAGDGTVLFPAAAAFYAAGRLSETRWSKDLGELSLEALAVSGIETQVLKFAVQRERPDGSDHYSFPSGHSSAAFSVATILAGEWGWTAGVPAFLGAGAIGYSRLELNKHFFSDVIFGAGLGIASGRAVLRAHSVARNQRVAVTPFFGPDRAGVAVAF
jgi:membrane-associated phospholipid phosphatase